MAAGRTYQQEKRKQQAKDVLWTRAYVLLMVSSFFSWLSYYTVTPVLTTYLTDMGASAAVCGFVGGILAGASLLTRPVSGLISNRFNRKWVNAWFTALMTISLFIYSLVPQIGVIEVFRALHGIGFGISTTASLVLITEVVSPARMTEAISYSGVTGVLAMTIGPSLGVIIGERAGYQNCLLFGSAMQLIGFVLAVMVPYQPPVAEGITQEGRNAAPDNRKTTPGEVLSSMVEVKILDISAMNATVTLMNGVVSTFVLEYSLEEGVQGASLYFVVNSIALVAIRVLFGRQMNKLSLGTVLVPAFLASALSLLLLWRASSMSLLILSAILKAFGQGFAQPALQTQALRSVPPQRRGTASSTIYIGGDLGQTVGPILGGVIADAAGYGNMFAISAIPLIASACYYILFYNRRKASATKQIQ